LPIAPLGVAGKQQMLAREAEQNDETLIVEGLVGRLCPRRQNIRLDVGDQRLDLVFRKKLEGIVGIGSNLKCLRKSLRRLIIFLRGTCEILVVGVGQLRDQLWIAGRPQNLGGKAGINEVLGKIGRIASPIIVVRWSVL